MMAIVILNQKRRESIYAVVTTVMNKQIPCVRNYRTGQESAAREQIDAGKAHPYLPKNTEYRFAWVGMMNTMQRWREMMKHNSMKRIFGQSPCDNAGDGKQGGLNWAKW